MKNSSTQPIPLPQGWAVKLFLIQTPFLAISLRNVLLCRRWVFSNTKVIPSCLLFELLLMHCCATHLPLKDKFKISQSQNQLNK